MYTFDRIAYLAKCLLHICIRPCDSRYFIIARILCLLDRGTVSQASIGARLIVG